MLKEKLRKSKKRKRKYKPKCSCNAFKIPDKDGKLVCPEGCDAFAKPGMRRISMEKKCKVKVKEMGTYISRREASEGLAKFSAKVKERPLNLSW